MESKGSFDSLLSSTIDASDLNITILINNDNSTFIKAVIPSERASNISEYFD